MLNDKQKMLSETLMTQMIQAYTQWSVQQTQLPTRNQLGHQCTTACMYFVQDPIFICRKTGDLHICNFDLCDSIIHTHEYALCRRTGMQYPLQMVMQIDTKAIDFSLKTTMPTAPSARAPDLWFAPQDRLLPVEDVPLSKRKNVEKQWGKVKQRRAVSSTTPSHGSMDRDHMELCVRALLDLMLRRNETSASRRSLALHTTVLGDKTPLLKETKSDSIQTIVQTRDRSRRKHKDLNLFLRKSKPVPPQGNHSTPMLIETRRMKSRKRRLISDDELTSEFYNRMAQLCLDTWSVVRTCPHVEQERKRYDFRYHCLAVFYKAQKGFKCHALDIPQEPILEDGLDDQNNLPAYGFERSILGKTLNVLNGVAKFGLDDVH